MHDSIYTESTEALVAFKFGMDFPENLVNIQLLIPFKQACWKYHDWGQNIENFLVKTLNGIAFGEKITVFHQKRLL